MRLNFSLKSFNYILTFNWNVDKWWISIIYYFKNEFVPTASEDHYLVFHPSLSEYTLTDACLLSPQGYITAIFFKLFKLLDQKRIFLREKKKVQKGIWFTHSCPLKDIRYFSIQKVKKREGYKKNVVKREK